MKVLHLFRIARDGFDDMGPALRRVLNEDSDDDNLQAVFGAQALFRLAVLTLLGAVAGFALNHYLAESANRLLLMVHWPVFFLAVFLALPIRRYLFRSGKATVTDFPWLAATIIPAVLLLAAITLISELVAGNVQSIEDGPAWSMVGDFLVVVGDATGHAAAITLAAAALCYTRNWIKALIDLMVLVLLLRMVLWFFQYVLLEIEIVQTILAELLDALFGIRLPSWLGDLSDRISFGLLLLGINFAVIGATWTTCRESFDTLLAEGEVNVVKAVREAVDPPSEKALKKREEKVAKKAAKAERKAQRKAERAARK